MFLIMENRRKNNIYTDADIVYGVYLKDGVSERLMFEQCMRYFNEHYQALFFVGDEQKKDIFQESFIQLWQNIEHQKIYVENGVLKGKNGEEFEGSLTTYLMSIASLKYKEWIRREIKSRPQKQNNNEDNDNELYQWILYGDDDMIKSEIISYCISHMSKRCSEILSRFYYEEKKLDDIIAELPTYQSKDALKTEKSKCLQRLKASSNELYNRLNA